MSLTSSSSVRVEWIAAVTIAAGTAAIGYLAYKRFYVKDHRNKAMINLHIQKDNPKIVHAFDMEDLGDKAVYCRCWRSKKGIYSKFDLCCWILKTGAPKTPLTSSAPSVSRF
ncbi:CISD1 isoform 1 [Pan troglodytes]|uniref:CISD1 isoform 1 n=1 Tax=Pan troglodytes TaxID=9598 RepID=A0A2J8NVJ7_PANTR|nr:CISD1 isoform 1 [Pan troglodytes]